ncbi:hypothetical protein DL96DRAFT_1016163 [Flagelloscypha sp. PMI_526]|nr:hypothetical protein DL96DRAFT_1016163 [Flagelloscypha sp. PMI_526]
MDPLFLPDIEREIFEFSAYADPKTMPFILILVAKHVQRWIEPLIYRHIDLYNKTSEVIPDILAMSRARGPNFLANAVRSISLENVPYSKTPTENLVKLLNACPSVKYLGICGGPFYPGAEIPDLQESIVKLERVTHLALPRADSFGCLVSSRASLGKPIPWNITHLDLGSRHFPRIGLLDDTVLPCLTHLAFGPFPEVFSFSGPHSIPAIRKVLDSRRHDLQCAWLTGKAWRETELMNLQDEEEYRRFLVVELTYPTSDEWMDNWNEMVEGTGCLWAPALKVLQKRAQGAGDGEDSTANGRIQSSSQTSGWQPPAQQSWFPPSKEGWV